MNIELRHIEQILALDKHRNFGRAAKELGLTQPALSQSVRVLEERLGVPLFSRSRPQIAPTVYGQHVVKVGRSLLLDAQRMEIEIAQLAGLAKGTLRVGAGPLPADLYMGAVLGKMNRLHSQHHLHLEVNWPHVLVSQLRAQTLDIIVVDTRMIEDAGDLDITPLPEDLGYWVCRAEHPLSRKKSISYEQILEYPVALFQFPVSLQKTVARRANIPTEQWNDAPNGKIECFNTNVLLNAIVACDAIGVAVGTIFQNEIANGKIVRLPIEAPELKTQFAAVVLNKYLKSPSVTSFTKYLLETAAASVTLQ